MVNRRKQLFGNDHFVNSQSLGSKAVIRILHHNRQRIGPFFCRNGLKPVIKYLYLTLVSPDCRIITLQRLGLSVVLYKGGLLFFIEVHVKGGAAEGNGHRALHNGKSAAVFSELKLVLIGADGQSFHGCVWMKTGIFRALFDFPLRCSGNGQFLPFGLYHCIFRLRVLFTINFCLIFTFDFDNYFLRRSRRFIFGRPGDVLIFLGIFRIAASRRITRTGTVSAITFRGFPGRGSGGFRGSGCRPR